MIKKAEWTIFHRHPFVGILILNLFLSLPWWLAFWPGTLQYDSCGQLLQYIGVGRMTGHHPYPVTMLMGALLDVGRMFFSSDNIGIFLYTLLQFLIQSCAIAYVFCLYEKVNTPCCLRWGSLFFYMVFPLIPNWGISYGKDTGYYVSFLLLITVMVDFISDIQKSLSAKRMFLWFASLVGIVAFRNDGRYIAVSVIIGLFLCYKEYRRISVWGAGAVIGFLVLVEGICMPVQNIPKGSVRETLSVPLMQTAMFIRDYREEITIEEEESLQRVFEVEAIEQIAVEYDRNISDNVKALFLEYPSQEELMLYFNVWWKQFLKHPRSYVQTYFEHCSGYFVLGERCYDDLIGWFGILDGESRRDEYLDIYFGNENPALRQWLENVSYRIYELPVVGWLFRPSLYTWTLLGTFLVILCQKRWRYVCLFMPAFAVIFICTISPLNSSVRYFLPVMVSMPLYISVCVSEWKQRRGL